MKKLFTLFAVLLCAISSTLAATVTSSDKAHQQRVQHGTNLLFKANAQGTRPVAKAGKQNVSTVNTLTGEETSTTWQKTGYILPADGWSGFYESALYQKVTVCGNTETNTITIYDDNNNDITMTIDNVSHKCSSITSGSDAVDYEKGGYTYFTFGDSYSQWLYAEYYDCYGYVDEATGYVTISSYFYTTQTDYAWGYVNIEWWDGIEEYIAELQAPATLDSTSPEVGSQVDIDTEYTFTFTKPVTYSVSLSDITVGLNPFSNEDGAIFTQSEDGMTITCKLDPEALAVYGITTKEDLISKMGSNVTVHLWKVKDAETGEVIEGCEDEHEDPQFAFNYVLGDPTVSFECYDEGDGISAFYFSCSEGIAINNAEKEILVMKNKEQFLSIKAEDLTPVSFGFLDDEDDFGYEGEETYTTYYYELEEPITEAGFYEVYIPEGTFLLAGTTENSTTIMDFEIGGEEEGPIENQLAYYDATASQVQMTFEKMVAPNDMYDGEGATILDEEGNTVATATVDYGDEYEDYYTVKLVFSAELAAGNYLAQVPEGMILAFKDMDDFMGSDMAGFEFNFTIEDEREVFITAATNEYGYATFSCNEDVELISEDATAYTAYVEGNVLQLEAIAADNYIPFSTGIVIIGEPNSLVEFALAESTTEKADIQNNCLLPTTTKFGLAEVPTEQGQLWALSGNKFCKFTGTEFTANRAYIAYDLSDIKEISISTGAATGIANIASDKFNGKLLNNGRIMIIKGDKKYNVAGQLIK